MLAITRRPNEKIAIGDEIRLTIIRVSGGQVRIGIDAPSDLHIDRLTPNGEVEKKETQSDE